MKANRNAIYNDEEAVSPVIAVILMVAITVVLAATVFVLVNELGQNVGNTGPQLGLTTANADAAAAGSWTVRITSATSVVPISEYNLVFTPPTGTPVSGEWATWGSNVTYSATQPVANVANSLSVGDRIQISGDFSTPGMYALELIHRPTGATAGTIQRQF
jgi:flagellin-like protein